MEADLVARIAAMGLAVGNRVSWVDRPKADALPAITLTRISPGRSYTHDGAIAQKDARVQADVWARSHVEAAQIEAALIAALEPAATVGSTKFGRAFLNGSPDLPTDMLGGVKVFRRAPDFQVWHEPA